MSISADEFGWFTLAKNLERACPDCGHQDSTSYGRPIAEDSQEVTRFHLKSDSSAEIGFYQLVCRNCGHAKLYEARLVERWVRAKRQAQNTAAPEHS